jgi:hypothetical protein
MTEFAHDADWGYLCVEYLHDPVKVTEILKGVEEALESAEWCVDGDEFRENRQDAYSYHFTGELQPHHSDLRAAFVQRLCMCDEDTPFSKLNT